MRKEAARADTIYRIDPIDRQAFEADYVGHRPVILTRMFERWPAAQWQLDKMRQAAGHREVDVGVYPNGDYYDEQSKTFERMKFGAYLDAISAPPVGARRLTLLTHLSNLPELERDVEVPDLVPSRALKAMRLDLRRDPVSPARYHPFTDYLSCQLVGDREVVLYPPEDTKNLYPQPIHTFPDSASSMVNLSKPDLQRYPRLNKLHPIRWTLRAGETLYLPLHWWIWNTGHGLSMSVDVYWRAPVSSWKVSVPALRVLAGVPIEKFRYRFGNKGVQA